MVQRESHADGNLAQSPLPIGYVDTRSVEELQPEDIPKSGQCHFFAGIGGWALACRLAGIRDDANVWTASLPCQPFSVSGAQRGFEDERHLFPVFYRLVQECRPAIIFGEQVASSLGIEWLTRVHTKMEDAGYFFLAATLPATCAGSPHARHRLFWCAWDGISDPRQLLHRDIDRCECRRRDRSEGHIPQTEERQTSKSDSTRNRRLNRTWTPSDLNELCNPECLRCSGQSWGRSGFKPENGFGDDGTWGNDCREWADGSTRRIEPGLMPLAYGFPERVGLIRGFGNAIVPQVAKIFIQECIETIGNYQKVE